MHVAKLVNANFLKVAAQGRHKYYTFARDEVAYVIEAMSNLIPAGMSVRQNTGAEISPIKYCRTCYDHLAGKVGVSLTEKLLETKIIRHDGDEFSPTKKGVAFFKTLEIDVHSLRQSRRFFAKPCLDWSERKYHMAGSLGAALLNTMLENDWIRKTRDSRAVIVTAKGQKAFLEYFSMKV
jgi:predicted transcriptional regulator